MKVFNTRKGIIYENCEWQVKPTLDLYMGRKVIGLDFDTDDDWDWSIVLEGDVEIRNKSRDETFSPEANLIGMRFAAMSLSQRDTTLHFMGEGNKKISVSFKPTQYVIADPRYGGEVYPQWPEELEETGITSHPDEPASAKPSEEWSEEEERLVREQDIRHSNDAQEFLKEDE